jgi:iron complex transport system substrate-binding protein
VDTFAKLRRERKGVEWARDGVILPMSSSRKQSPCRVLTKSAPCRPASKGNRRDVVFARRAGSHRRHFRLLRAAARGAPRQAAGIRFHLGGYSEILALRPDLVLSFSDLQADIVASLIRLGAAVHAFNQRTVADIFDMIRMVGATVGAANKVDRLASELEAGIADARRRGQQLWHRPLAYFEEWKEPMISGIGWVSELIGIAGGTDIFADRAIGKSASERIVTAIEIIARRPEIIIGSWCGKKFRPEKVAARPGFEQIPAIRNEAVYEIKSPIILQRGPAALTDG